MRASATASIRVLVLLALLPAVSACSAEDDLDGSAEPARPGAEAASGSPPPLPPSGASGTWSSERPMLHQRNAHAVVALDDGIYALGGTGRGAAAVMEVERFDGTAWHVVGTLPGDGLNAPAAAVLDGRIWLIGGFETTTNVPSDRVHVFDPASGVWEPGPSLPAPRGGHAALVHEGRIHVFGGGNSQSTLADHTVYDPAEGTWRDAAPLPRSEGSPAAVTWNGRIHVIGGRSGPSDFGDVYIYDAAADRWEQGPALEPRGTHGAAVFEGAIYVFGGESQAERRALGEVLRLGPGERAWQVVDRLPTPRTYPRAVVWRDAIWTVGGSPAAGASHSSEGSAVVERWRPTG